MSDGRYTGHTAEEVVELMGMLAAQYDIHSASEALAIARKGRNLIADQQEQINALLLKLETVEKARDDWRRAAANVHTDLMKEIDARDSEIAALKDDVALKQAALEGVSAQRDSYVCRLHSVLEHCRAVDSLLETNEPKTARLRLAEIWEDDERVVERHVHDFKPSALLKGERVCACGEYRYDSE